MMILLVKEYLEEIHGYSLQEAAFIVTIPSNIAQFVLGLCVGSLGDLMVKKNVDVKTVRRVGAGVQILAIIPLLVLPFLPCEVVSFRATMVIVQVKFSLKVLLPANLFSQVLCSFRVFGNLAGFSSFKDISPTFQVKDIFLIPPPKVSSLEKYLSATSSASLPLCLSPCQGSSSRPSWASLGRPSTRSGSSCCPSTALW